MRAMTAESILSQYWDGTIPVNLYSIATQLGVAVMSDPSLAYHDASGHYIPEDNSKSKPATVTYNPHEHPVRQRFTIAHEIGHHALSHGESNRDTPSNFMSMNPDQKERDANTFAAALLMPTEAIRAMVEVKRITNIERLAELFHVSRPAMTYRLKGLGYVVN